MPREAEGSIDAVLCFDANLPQMDECHGNCPEDDHILCCHRFNFYVRMLYCNKPGICEYSDLEIILYFLEFIRNNFGESDIGGNIMFAILTWDKRFLAAAKREWQKRKNDLNFNIDFFRDHVICGNTKIYVEKVNCKNYGPKQRGRRLCIVHKANKLFKEHRKA